MWVMSSVFIILINQGFRGDKKGDNGVFSIIPKGDSLIWILRERVRGYHIGIILSIYQKYI